MIDEHYCPYKEEIRLTGKRVNGTEDDPGIFSDVKTILANQKKTTTWLTAIFCTCFLLICGMVYWGITDHNKIADMPTFLYAKFVDKEDFNVATANQTKLNYMLMTTDSNNRKDVDLLMQELERIRNSYNYIGATRGATRSDLPTKLPGGIDPEKLYNELKRQKAEGSDSGTYRERVNRVDKKLLK